jgi:hypothetical protein
MYQVTAGGVRPELPGAFVYLALLAISVLSCHLVTVL